MVKLTDKKITWIVRNVAGEKVSTKEAARTYGITQRRAQQLVRAYREEGEVPKLNPDRRPRTYLTEEDRRIIDDVWEETRFGSRHLYKELRRRGYRIPKNKILDHLRRTGKSIPNPNKQKKRRRCGYEREHSFSLVHAYHRRCENDPYAIAWLDDASRMVLSCGEFDEATTEHAIDTFDQAILKAEEYCGFIDGVNTDRGSQFYSNKNRPSRFERYLESNGITYMPSRRNNPQTNGKLERFWLEYDRHRFRFDTVDEFVDWYNHRLHGALWMDVGENPNEAVIRKLPVESMVGLFCRLGGL